MRLQNLFALLLTISAVSVTTVIFIVSKQQIQGHDSQSDVVSPSDGDVDDTTTPGDKDTEISLKHYLVIDNLQRCLDTANLTEYFHSMGYFDAAVKNARHVVEAIHLFLPHHFRNQSKNHCWATDMKVSLNGSIFSGSIKNYSFKLNTNGVVSFVLNRLASLSKRRFTGSFHHVCLPEVYLLGFPKCGSTHLFEILISHPEFVKSFAKEPHFWDREYLFSLDLEKLTAFFAMYLINYLRYHTSQNTSTSILLEGTPQTVYYYPFNIIPSSSREVNFCLLPAVIPAVLPRSKFIIVMRDPVNTLYSFFWFSCTRRRGSVPPDVQLKGPDLFHNRVTERINDFNSCIERLPVAKCVFDASLRYKSDPSSELSECGFARLGIAIYYIHVQRWLSVVPREQLLLLTLEELSSHTDAVVSKVWQFVGVSDFHGYEHGFQSLNQQMTVNYHTNPILKMRNDTKRLLQDFFAPYNMKLANLVNNNRFLWNYSVH